MFYIIYIYIRKISNVNTKYFKNNPHSPPEPPHIHIPSSCLFFFLSTIHLVQFVLLLCT